MFESLLQMFLLIACGLAWRYLEPGAFNIQTTRQVLTTVVYYLLLPALILDVMWKAPLNADTWRIAVLAAVGVFSGMLVIMASCRVCHSSGATTGAAILAAAFPNATYLGLPVLETTFGPWARSVAIQYDLLACTPILLTLGIALASRFGTANKSSSMLLDLLRVPPLWAMAVAIALNLSGVPTPKFLDGMFDLLGRSVVPLMLLALGMSLRLQALKPKNLIPVAPVVLIQLLIMPLIVWGGAYAVGLSAHLLAPVVLEAAMPSMVLGLVIADRFKLNSELYAAAVVVTTAISLFTLPLWFEVLGRF